MHTKDNIKQYFLQQCSAEEAARMANWLVENPNALEEYMTEAEWNEFQQTNFLAAEVSGAIWEKVRVQTHDKKTAVFYIRRLAVAASVMLMVVLGWYAVKKPSTTNNTVTLVNDRERIPQQQVTVNNGSINQRFSLNDGSEVELMPGSSLSYPDTFTSDKRLVSLTGEAVFHVAQNKEMPFVVNSGTISTTALGTVFKVKSHQKSNHIEVSLLEGRVVVRALHAGSKFKDIYLKPGETVMYNKTLETGAIAASPAPHKDKPEKISVSETGTTNAQSYWFQNEPLEKVFDRFSNMYHLTIRYDKAELKNMTFTARLKKEDSPDNVLQSIALLNDLKIEKTSEGYSVKKN